MPLTDMHAEYSALALGMVKQEVDTYLKTYFEEKIAAATTIDPSYERLWRSIARLSAAGGKRLRPYVLLLAYEACAADKDSAPAILPAAAAQELLHLALLIHDDIIDRDTIRYGIKNIVGQYDATYREALPDASERRHFSHSAALLAGDLLISQSHVLLQRCDVACELVDRSQAILAEGVFYVAGGELLDTESAFMSNDTISAHKIADFKTARYSCVSPLTMGAVLAGASDPTIRHLTDLGQSLGIAYQLKDDLLGIFGDGEVTGKSTSSDIREGKHTYLLEQFMVLAADHQRQEFLSIYGRGEPAPRDHETICQLFIQSGAVAAVEHTILKHSTHATASLMQLGFEEKYHIAFLELIRRCSERDK